MPANPHKHLCRYVSPRGIPCASYAQRGGEFCRAHDPAKPAPNPRGARPGNRNALKPRYASEFFGDADLMALATMGTGTNLDDEIALARLTLRHLAATMNHDLSTGELVAMARILFRGAGRVARLLKAQRAVSSPAADGVFAAAARAIEELDKEAGTGP